MLVIARRQDIFELGIYNDNICPLNQDHENDVYF